MRILCCLDGTNVEALKKATDELVNMSDSMLGLLYVTDEEPRHEMLRTRHRLFRDGFSEAQEARLTQAEQFAAQHIMAESRRYFPQGEQLQRVGRAEREIVQCAIAWQADLILVCPRRMVVDRPQIGPKSVGHVARFVLDHAPCPVLLVRMAGALPPPPPPHGLKHGPKHEHP
jgi:nucleotide-binding universal stress UspA family protein